MDSCDPINPNNMADSKRRQIEINEWTYHNTMETLFIFQLFFVGLATMIILLVLAKYGFFARLFAIYTGIVVLIILVIIGIVRRLYTKNVRDKRHWNERVFQGDNAQASLVPPQVLAATSIANQQVCAVAKGTAPATPVVVNCP